MARDSGKRAGDDRRMREGNSALNWVFYRAAFASLRSFPESRAFCDRERVASKMHNQVLIALTRRRVNVLWATMRGDSLFDAAFAA